MARFQLGGSGNVPTVSGWGMLALAVTLLLSGMAVIYVRRAPATASTSSA